MVCPVKACLIGVTSYSHSYNSVLTVPFSSAMLASQHVVELFVVDGMQELITYHTTICTCKEVQFVASPSVGRCDSRGVASSYM